MTKSRDVYYQMWQIENEKLQVAEARIAELAADKSALLAGMTQRNARISELEAQRDSAVGHIVADMGLRDRIRMLEAELEKMGFEM